MKVAGLFAGIGGIELGLHRAGHESVLLCEVDPAAKRVLEKRFEGTGWCDDVRDLLHLPADADLLTAGFPCQDLSQAGRTRGIGGAKSGLIGHVFRLLDERKLPWLLIENVPFMLQLDRGAAMEYLVENLEIRGYSWAYRVVDTRSFGLPQRRRRVYLLASRDINPATLLSAKDMGEREIESDRSVAHGFYWTEGLRGLGWAVDAVPTLKGGSTVGIASPPAIWMPNDEIVTPDIRDAERLQGFPVDWTKPAESVARAGHRWRLVGNAVTVRAAQWLGELLHGGDFREPVEATKLNGKRAWPTAAYGSRAGRWALDLSEWPVRWPYESLADFLQYPVKPLSRRATAGFLSRLKRSSLRYPEEFGKALESHLTSLAHAAEEVPA